MYQLCTFFAASDSMYPNLIKSNCSALHQLFSVKIYFITSNFNLKTEKKLSTELMDYLYDGARNTSENTKSPSKLSSVGKALIYTTGGLAVGVSIVCIPFVSPAFRRVCLPYVPATTDQLLGVTKALAGRSGRLLDVGSGDGRIVFTAAKLGFNSDGVELNPWLVYYSRIAALFDPQCRKSKFYRRNLWMFDLKPYDNIVIFGVEQMMQEFENKLLAEANQNTVVVACRFPLPNMTPVETIGHGVDTVWKYVIKR